MNYIVCGTVVCEKYENKILQLSNAANRFLLNFTDEMKKKHSVKILSYMGINVSSEIKEGLKDENTLGTDMSYYFKSKFRVMGVIVYWCAIWRNLKGADCIIAYNPVYAYLNVPHMAKQYGKKSILILADYSPRESYKGYMRRLYADLQLRSIRKYDIVIGLSENIRKYLEDGQEFIYMPGGINHSVYDYFGQRGSVLKSNKLIFMYAGTLEKVTGIDMLLDAFEHIKADNVELWVSGKGSLVKFVEKSAKKDNRIKYLGCPPYSDYLNNLKNACVLINPRNMELPENENNFPSKILEYLSTGKPIISTRFQGYEQFKNNIFFVDNSVESLKAAMIKSLDHDEQMLTDLYRENRLFAKTFLWSNQVGKINAINYCSVL